MRVATYHARFSGDGPALLLRDLSEDPGPEIEAAIGRIVQGRPDILLLTDFDFDLTGAALSALQTRLAEEGHPMQHGFAARTNAGWQDGFDLDGDGREGEPEDAHGYGAFAGQGGMAVLSVHPFDADAFEDHSQMLWSDLPGSHAGDVGLPAETLSRLRLASDGHWVLPVETPNGLLHLFAFHAQTPVFDGDEDRNGLRNADQLMFWHQMIESRRNTPNAAFVLLGNANNDPDRGEGLKEPLRALLAHPFVQDQLPGQVTVDWPEDGPGPMRVSYVLPSTQLQIRDAGILRADPPPNDPPHKLVWVDLRLPPSVP